MDNSGKDISIQIMEALKDILPPKMGFIMIVGELGGEDIGITSNLPDHVALGFLEDAIISIDGTPAIDLEQEVKLNRN